MVGAWRLLAAFGAVAVGLCIRPTAADDALPPPVARPGPRRALPGPAVAAPRPLRPAPVPAAGPAAAVPSLPGRLGGVRGSDEPESVGGLVTPSPRPPRPAGAPKVQPEDLVFEVERPGGVLKRFPEPDGIVAWVMVGNPRVLGQAHVRKDGKPVDALAIKANRMVVWVDEQKVPDVGRLFAGEGGGNDDGERMITAFFEEAVLGLFAEGAVEVSYGTVAFRADALYFEPRTFKALMIEPRFDGRIVGLGAPAGGIPLYARGRRGRLVARGVMVFDDAEVSTSRADDRMALQVRSLTMEEYDREQVAALGPAPALLGFKSLSTQRFSARDIELWGERVPFARIPSASFGGEKQDPFPVTIKRLEGGERSEFGLYGFVGVGGPLGPEGEPWGEWILDAGGYTKRGPALGGQISWGQHDSRTRGRIGSRFVYDTSTDRDGFDPGDGVRYRVVSENRTLLADDLVFDAEFNDFSDRGFNQEFYEREDRTHKDRESYLRLLYRPSTWAATLTGKWHQRDFVTETVEAPQAGLWVTGVPVLAPARAGGFGVDVTSVTQAGWLGRRFDEDLALAKYDALRVDTDTRLEAGVDVGDVRLSGWLGGSATSYQERTDGGEDLTRTALLAGIRANLQAHRVYGTCGGPFELNGLRHVVDVDVEASGRFWDSNEPADVPFFDSREQEEERSEVALRLRNRAQTRRPRSADLRNVIDLETAFRWNVDDVAPYLQRSPWGFTWSLQGEPLESGRLYVASEGDLDGWLGLISTTVGVGVRPNPQWDIAVAYRYLLDEASAPLFQASWRWSEKYSLRFTESYNFKNADNDLKLLFRRHSNDHIWSFGLRLDGDGDLGFELDFRPTIGEVGETPSLFVDEVDLDPTRAFR